MTSAVRDTWAEVRETEKTGKKSIRGGFSERAVRRAERRCAAYAACGLPADTDCVMPKVSLTGSTCLTVEHHLGVLLISESVIRLHTAIGILRIEGNKLCASVLTADELVLKGRIASVSYE